MPRLNHRSPIVSLLLTGALSVATSFGCATEGDDDGTFNSDPGAGGSGNSSSGGSSSGGSSAGSGTGGSTLVGGSSSGGSTSNGGAGGECLGVNAAADAGVDIIWAIDNSGSMGDEVAKIRTELNNSFLSIIQASNLSWNLMMVTERGAGSQAICVDSPPAGPGCADAPPRFYHVQCPVQSTDAFLNLAFSYDGVLPTFGLPTLICGQFALPGFPVGPPEKMWKNFARINATKVFIVVTDDESDTPAAAFDNWLLTGAQPPGMFGSAAERKYIFHGIIGLDPNNPSAACSSATNDAVEPGLIYQELATTTGGSVASICEDDWSAIFNEIANSIVTRLSCEYPVPDPPNGGTLDENAVNVLYFPGENGPEETIPRDNTSDCAAGADGWQWNAARDKILLCGETCERIKADPDGKVEIKFGCKTEDVIK
jgi:hypothetical protein